MKKLIFILSLSSSLIFAQEHRDGTYRGVFISGQETQVEVQFDLKNDKVSNPKFRTLFFRGKDFLKNKKLEKLKKQYEALLIYLNGKNVDDAIELFYTPDKIEMAGATIRASKVRGAIKNALNSDVYKPSK